MTVPAGTPSSLSLATMRGTALSASYTSISIPDHCLPVTSRPRLPMTASPRASPFTSSRGSIQEKGLFENRVTLGGTTRFGLPRTRIDIPARGYTDEVLNAYLERMKGIVAEMGLELVFAGSFPQRGDHAMGTARMAASDTDGVVGPDLRVHGVDNLYVASNAVFPQSMAANPTLTLIAAIFKALDSIPARAR
jgi:choline dehydrogenase-like flavoprotein